MSQPLRLLLALLLALALAAAACTGDEGQPSTQEAPGGGSAGAPATEAPTAPPTLRPTTSGPAGQVAVLGEAEPAALALGASQALFDEAPLVLLAPDDAPGEQARAASAAVHLGAPLLLHTADGTDLGRELRRLGTSTALAFGPVPASSALPDDVELLGAPEDGAALADLLAGDTPRAVAAGELAAAVAELRPGAGELLLLEPEEPATEPDADEGPDPEAAPGSPAPAEPSPGADEPGEAAAGEPTAQAAVAGVAATTAPAQAPSPAPTAAPSPAPTASPGPTAAPSPTPTAPATLDVAPAEELPEHEPAEPLEDVRVLVDGGEPAIAALATALAAGAEPLVMSDPDPRADPAAIAALAEAPPEQALVIGQRFGDAEQVGHRLAVAATGVELPGGGQVLFPHRRFAALYGHPGSTVLGALGEQPLDGAVARAREVAASYDPHSDIPVVPTFEVITTIASAAAEDDGSYSRYSDIEHIRPWVDRAGAEGFYVVLDLQPGRTDFLTQARAYEELLRQPHVGLALDPEWRLGPDQRHMRQIGSVGADEVNEVVHWLADLTREHDLPQKLLVLHQFKHQMLPDRERIDTGRDELAVLVHMDGHGPPSVKRDTWRALTGEPMPGAWWGWKNFYDEDSPTMSPEETLAVEPPQVLFISYQ